MFILAKYSESPFVEKETIINRGINHAKVLSFSINIFFTAGSSSQAIPEVLPATNIDKTSATIILLICFFTYSL